MKRAERRRPERIPQRFLTIGLGALLGFGWGSLMWAVTGSKGGVRVWLYLAITMAMIGCGVAAFFGAFVARRRGERVSPKVRLPFRRREE